MRRGHFKSTSSKNSKKQPHYTFQSCMLRRRNSGAYGKRTKGNTATVTNVAYEDSECVGSRGK